MFEWSLNPYMGCAHRCTFCYVRAFERRADRPVGRPVRALDPREGQRRRGARARARAAVVEGASGRRRRGDRSVPAGRGALPADARVHRGARRGVEPVLDHHARPDDRARRRRARRRRRAARRCRSRSRSRRSTRTSGAGPSRRPRTRDSDCARSASSSTPGSTRASAWRRSCRASPTGPSSSREVVRAAREAGATGIWANVLYLKPGTREHFLESLARDWPEQLAALRASCTRTAARTSPAAETKPVRAEVARLAREHDIRDRRARPARAARRARAARAPRCSPTRRDTIAPSGRARSPA